MNRKNLSILTHAQASHVVLKDGVEDDHSNVTRFVLLAGPGQDAPSDVGASWKSSVFFAGEGDSTPGWLLRCLAEFAERGVNLSRIESRPAKRRLGHYVFLVDVGGRADEPGPAADAISALGEHCEEVRLLGAYPAASG